MLDTKMGSCPAAPQARATVHTRVLHRACLKVGGVEQLARHLGVPVAAVYRWLEGESAPPATVFLSAVDLIMPPWTAEEEAASRELRARRPAPDKKKI